MSLSLPRPWLVSWPAIAAGVLVFQAAVSLTLTQPSSRTTFNAVVSIFLLLLATGITALNAVESRHAIRLFWSFLAVGCGLWALSPVFWIIHVVSGKDTPDFWLSTTLLLLHNVMFIAAAASRPHLKQATHKPYRTTLNFLLLLFLIVFAYAFFQIPYQTMRWDPWAIVRFGNWYFAQNLFLLGVISAMIMRARQPWTSIYWHLLGASLLYAVLSLLLNILVARYGTAMGSQNVIYNAAACWFVWVALRGRKLAPQLEQAVQLDTTKPKYAFPFALVAVVAVPVFGIWDLFRIDEPYRIRVIRLLVVLVSFLFLAIFVLVGEYLAGRDLAVDAGSANERLRLAMESAKSVGWDWDVKSGRDFWFGDLDNMFGIPADAYSGYVEDFHRRVHPDDRTRVGKAVQDARQSHGPYAAEFRVVRLDGTVRWIAARGKFSYDAHGEAERMLGMATDITEAKRTEEALRESQDKLSLVLESTAEGIFGTDLEGRCTFCNPACLQQLGYARAEELLGQNMHALIHHTRADGEPYTEEECPGRITCRTGKGTHGVDEPLWKRDGTSFPAEYWAHPQRKGGKIVGAVVTFIDITDRKRTEEALSNVGRRLIAAHEEERAWIARELHDDIGQRLALLSIELESLRHISSHSGEFPGRMHQILHQTSEIANEIQTISHRLHSSKLEYLGLVAAARGYCAELAEQQRVKIDFLHDAVPRGLPSEIEMCLFRVLQEALRNAVKHSRVQHIKVELHAGSKDLHLMVRDSGVGFDPGAALLGKGLGLISMQERLRLVNGELTIHSSPNSGTAVHAYVPLH